MSDRSLLDLGHKWISEQSPLTSGVNYCQWFEDDTELPYKSVCYHMLNYGDKKTPEILTFQLINPNGEYQEAYEHFFNPKESPWKIILPQIEIHKDNDLITGVVCTNEVSAQGLINLLIACRSLQEFDYLPLWKAFQKHNLNPYEAFYLCHLFNNGTNPEKLNLRSFDSGHGPFYQFNTDSKTNINTYLSGTPTLREHGFGPELNYSPCNTMWCHQPQGKASNFVEFFKKEHPSPKVNPYSFNFTPPHTVTTKQATDAYFKWKETL